MGLDDGKDYDVYFDGQYLGKANLSEGSLDSFDFDNDEGIECDLVELIGPWG